MLLSIRIIIVFFTLFEGAELFAQDSASPATRPHNYLESYWHNGIGMAKTPARWNREKWLEAAGLIAITGMLIPMDEVLNIPFVNWSSNGGNQFGKWGNFAGDLPAQLGFTAASIGVGLLADEEKWVHFGLDNLQAQIYTGGITFVVKEIFQRARPESGEGNYAWYGPFKKSGNDSFTSGHTGLAFATATMVFLYGEKKWWVGLLSYGLATGIGLSRMQQQKHWASDVAGGALLGTVVSSYVYKQQAQRRKARQRLKTIP